jgi:hypothetical protein
MQEMRDLMFGEFAKYQVLPLDASASTRFVTPRPSAAAGRNVPAAVVAYEQAKTALTLARNSLARANQLFKLQRATRSCPRLFLEPLSRGCH